MTNTSNYLVYPFIIYYKSFSPANFPLGLRIQVSSLVAPTTYNMTVTKFVSTGLNFLGFSILVINNIEMANQQIVRFRSTPSYATNNLFYSPTSFGIPNLYGNSSFGGFDGNCVIGLHIFFLG